MSDWHNRAQINHDVISFEYIKTIKEQSAEEVYVWDLDKTYLDTKFESLRGLFRTIVEKAIQKQNVPGTAALVRSLQDSWQQRFEQTEFPIFFITASPPQMERKIIEKLNIDGVQPIGIYCKDNLHNLRPKRLWRLTKQVGYKLQALMQMRLLLYEDVRQILWGDDSESDVIIYCLYSDICTRRLSQGELEKTLKAFHVTGQQLQTIFELQEQVPKQDPVEKIYINLAEDTDSEYYLKFGRRTLPTFNTFQAALDLFQDGRLNDDHVISVAQDLKITFGFSSEELEKSFDDLVRRKSLAEASVAQILPRLKAEGILNPHFELSLTPKVIVEQVGDRVYGLEGNFEPWVPERIDYLHNYR